MMAKVIMIKILYCLMFLSILQYSCVMDVM